MTSIARNSSSAGVYQAVTARKRKAVAGNMLDGPRHAVVRRELLDEISSGRLAPGDQVPTELQLMERYDVSRTTVRRALRDLETMGLIDRQPGRGSFVNEPRLEPRLDRLTGFVEDMESLGLNASASVELIEKTRATKDVSEHLRVQPRSVVVHIQRVRLANGTPISFDDSYFPPDLGGRIAQENLVDEPFYSILEGKYGMALVGADYVVSASVADELVARKLNLAVGSPVLRLERTSFVGRPRQPILFEYLHFAGPRFSYRLTVER